MKCSFLWVYALLMCLTTWNQARAQDTSSEGGVSQDFSRQILEQLYASEASQAWVQNIMLKDEDVRKYRDRLDYHGQYAIIEQFVSMYQQHWYEILPDTNSEIEVQVHDDMMAISWRENVARSIVPANLDVRRFGAFNVSIYSVVPSGVYTYTNAETKMFGSMASKYIVLPRQPLENIYLLVQSQYKDEDRTLVWFKPGTDRAFHEDRPVIHMETQPAAGGHTTKTIIHVFPNPNYYIWTPWEEAKSQYLIRDASQNPLPGSKLQLYYDFPGIGARLVWESAPMEDARIRIASADNTPRYVHQKEYEWRVDHPKLDQIRAWPDDQYARDYNHIDFPVTLDASDLIRSRWVSGIVTDDKGARVEGARVEFRKNERDMNFSRVAFTNANGSFELEPYKLTTKGFLNVSHEKLSTKRGLEVTSGSWNEIELSQMRMLTIQLAGLRPGAQSHRDIQLIKPSTVMNTNAPDLSLTNLSSSDEGIIQIEHPGQGRYSLSVASYPTVYFDLNGTEEQAVIEIPPRQPRKTPDPVKAAAEAAPDGIALLTIKDGLTGQPIEGVVVSTKKTTPIKSDANGMAELKTSSRRPMTLFEAEGYISADGNMQTGKRHEIRLLPAGTLRLSIERGEAKPEDEFRVDLTPNNKHTVYLDSAVPSFYTYYNIKGLQHDLPVAAGIEWLILVQGRGENTFGYYTSEQTFTLDVGEVRDFVFRFPRQIQVDVVIDAEQWDDRFFQAGAILRNDNEFIDAKYPRIKSDFSKSIGTWNSTMNPETGAIELNGWEGWKYSILLYPMGREAGAQPGYNSPIHLETEAFTLQAPKGESSKGITIPISAAQLAEWKAKLGQ